MLAQPDHVYHPWRRYLRFSLRGLIVVVLLIGLCLEWAKRGARTQREAVAALRKRANVLYDWQWENGRLTGQSAPWAPKWLVDVIGVDYFGHVVWVGETKASDDDALRQIGQFGRLRVFRQANTSDVTDAGLVHFKGLTNLSKIELVNAKVTDAGLAHLNGLKNLTELDLARTQITDAGLANLDGLSKLSKLALSGTQVTGTGLVHLKRLNKLSHFCLSFSQLTDAGLAGVTGLANLSSLDLDGTKLSDAGLVHLRGLTRLSELDISFTQVTAAGIDELKTAVPSLKKVHGAELLRRTQTRRSRPGG